MMTPENLRSYEQRRADDPMIVLEEETMAPKINPTHEAADAFWKYWAENGETHRHGYYESTWGAINAALAVSGVSRVSVLGKILRDPRNSKRAKTARGEAVTQRSKP